jgi:repressor LexA
MAPTSKQRRIYEALLFLKEKGEIPTVREVAALVGLNSPATVMKHLQALEREGLIAMSGKSRGIKVLGSESHPSVGIPVVGRIAAGPPIEAVPEEETTLNIDPKLFSGSGELMALRVVGESMIEAGILNGDFVIIRRQPTVEEGEIAAVQIEEGGVEGEVTLKRLSTSGSGLEASGPSVRLIPANSRFQPIELNASDRKEVRILGKYVGLIRGDIGIS